MPTYDRTYQQQEAIAALNNELPLLKQEVPEKANAQLSFQIGYAQCSNVQVCLSCKVLSLLNDCTEIYSIIISTHDTNKSSMLCSGFQSTNLQASKPYYHNLSMDIMKSTSAQRKATPVNLVQ